MPRIQRADIIEPQLSYKIVGILFDVFNSLGSGRREYVYQRAIKVAFQTQNVSFVEQMRVPLMYKEIKIGTAIIDFVVENSVILEIKAASGFRKSDYKQTRDYLVATDLLLAILARFGPEGVVFYRVLNPNHS